MNSSEKQDLGKPAKDADKNATSGWRYNFVDKWVLSAAAIISTIIFGINTCKHAKVEYALDKTKFEREYALDTAKFANEVNAHYLDLYFQAITKGDSLALVKANVILKMINDTDIRENLISIPADSATATNGELLFGKKGSLQVSVNKDLLLGFSKIKVYYKDSSYEGRADSINTLLKLNGVKEVEAIEDTPKQFTANGENEIVYYKPKQINSCLAVQNLLSNNGYINFKIRISSQSPPKDDYFRIDVAK